MFSQEKKGAISNGYEALPLVPFEKNPLWKGWTGRKMGLNDVDFYEENGLGIKTALTPFVDIDVLDGNVVQEIIEWCQVIIGPSPVRTGQAPKVGFFCRWDAPRGKSYSDLYIDSEGRRHRIEILGDGQQAVAFGIHPTTREPYRWAGGSPETVPAVSLPMLTPDLIQMLFDYFYQRAAVAGWRRVDGAGGVIAGSIADGFADPLMAAAVTIPPVEGLTDTDIETMSKNVDVDDRNSWIDLGMRIHHQTGGEQNGLAIWERVSRRSPKFKAGECQKIWKSFTASSNASGQVTFHKIKNAFSQQKQAAQGLEEYLRRYVLVEEGKKVHDLDAPARFSSLKIDEFLVSKSNIRLVAESTTGRPKSSPLANAWLCHDARQTARSEDYAPGAPRLFFDELQQCKKINTFCLPPHASEGAAGTFEGEKRGGVGTLIDHVSYLCPEDSDAKWMLSWMAYIVQNPQKRCKVTPLHLSPVQGTGRGWIVELMRGVLGDWNCSTATMASFSLENGFNEFVNDKLFCSVEEVYESDAKRYSVLDRIRSLLTEDFVEVNLKYGKKGSTRIYTNFFLMSNHFDALVIKDNDRRIQVIRGAMRPRESDYYKHIYQWLCPENFRNVYKFLKNLDISGFDYQRAALNEAKAAMIDATKSQLEFDFDTWLKAQDNGVGGLAPKTLEEITQEISIITERFVPEGESKQLTHLLRGAGFNAVREGGGKRRRVWTRG